MRWERQGIEQEAPSALPGLARMSNLIRSVQTPEFAGLTFHEVAAKSALNKVAQNSRVPFAWTVNPYRGCSHACVYCFARATHPYLGLDAGRDFDSQIIVKVNIADVLRAELARPSWDRTPVALGTNTDPYQRAEGKYRLMPGIISALADSGTPFSITTKGTLLRRDLGLLTDAADRVPVSIAVSIAVFDDELQRTVEPGTPATAARLATVRAAVDAGLDVSVFMMPLLPFLTDSEEQLDGALERAAAAGASSVEYSPLRLKPDVKEWYAQWLGRVRPDLVPRYRRLFGRHQDATDDYRRELSARIRPLIAKHGLARSRLDPQTGSPAPAPAPAPAAIGPGAPFAAAAPTLF